MSIQELLTLTIESQASDLHIAAGMPLMLRIDGDLHKINLPSLDSKAARELIYELMNAEQQQGYEQELELDFSYHLAALARFRVNAFHQQQGPAAALRLIPNKVSTLETLGLPAIIPQLLNKQQGLILVTGPTGSGKSTSLAAMVAHINQQRAAHVLTIEDPIEFIHQSQQGLINQREVHRDTHSFNQALRSALREDPDVILIGELRDPETIRLALTAAETGHLVLATLHTNSAAKTINRIVDVFPAGEKEMVRAMLAESLLAVISQILIKRTAGGRIAAHEMMICTPAIRHLIRENKIPQIYSTIQTSLSLGMHTLDMHLHELLNANIISRASAKEYLINKESLE